MCKWGIPNHSLLQRVAAIDLPVFVANGDTDPMILPRYSYLLTGLLPDARLKISPRTRRTVSFSSTTAGSPPMSKTSSQAARLILRGRSSATVSLCSHGVRRYGRDDRGSSSLKAAALARRAPFVRHGLLLRGEAL